MINLFHIPTYNINTALYSNLLHDKIVRKFEEEFAEYVGAKYAVSFNSATSAIFLIWLQFKAQSECAVLPSMIPPVVPNAILNANRKIKFVDNVDWVGNAYFIDNAFSNPSLCRIIDSAQQVDKNQFQKMANPDDLMIFSFYPTKPVGSCDGGMVVSDDLSKIEELREMTMNGMSFAENNWDRKLKRVGHRMYMNSIQAHIASLNLKALEEKKEALAYLREKYNRAFGLNNTSDHLYRIPVVNNREVLNKAKAQGIVCGIHYEPLHTNSIYRRNSFHDDCPLSEIAGEIMLSIPFHENLTGYDIQKVIQFVDENREI